MLAEYESRICRFYVWHLIRGVCILNEYIVTDNHTLKEGRKNVRKLLRAKDVQETLKNFDRTGLSWKNRLQIFAMKHSIELLFYYLYVIKPNKKKGLRHEN